jgi:hypothetical protein
VIDATGQPVRDLLNDPHMQIEIQVTARKRIPGRG